MTEDQIAKGLLCDTKCDSCVMKNGLRSMVLLRYYECAVVGSKIWNMNLDIVGRILKEEVQLYGFCSLHRK